MIIMTLGTPQQDVWENSNFSHLGGQPIFSLQEGTNEIISSFSGAYQSGIDLFVHIVPYFSLFNSIYFRAVSRKSGLISSDKQMGGGEVTNSVRFGEQNGPEWVIPREDWDYEYEQFLNWYIENRNLGPQEAVQEINEQRLGEDTSKRFYEYFTGRETPLISIGGSCSWPLGCVQNLNPDEFPFSERLLSENEHSKPGSLFDYSANQKMCCPHNRWKTANPLFDVGGMLWCIYGEALD